MKLVNTNHPTWLEFKTNYEFIPDVNVLMEKHANWVADLLDGDERLAQCKYHVFGSKKFTFFVVYEFENGFLTHIAGPMGDELELFSTLDEAIERTFADWFPENNIGDFNDEVTQFIVDGEWLIDLESK